MGASEDTGLHCQECIVQGALLKRKLYLNRFGLPRGEVADVTTTCAIDEIRKGRQVLRMPNESEALLG